jgi:hypothetical protein
MRATPAAFQSASSSACAVGRWPPGRRIIPEDEQGKYTERPMPLLKTIRFTTNKFRELTLDMAKAQLMCWQASQEGLIYPYLDKEKHLLRPSAIARKITGESYPEEFTLAQLIALFKARDGKWVAGIDYGFTHNFSVVLMYIDGARAFVVARYVQPELDPGEKIDLLDRTIKDFDPIVYGDTEAPDMNKFLKKHGYRVKEWNKGPGSVLSGIETVRYKLAPGIIAEPQLFFVDGGPGVNEHVEALRLYHWALGSDGKPTNEPDEIVFQTEDGETILDDECDALRYGLMNTFKNRGKLTVSREEIKAATPAAVKRQQTTQAPMQQVWAKQILDHAMGIAVGNEGVEDPTVTQEQPAAASTGRKGSLFWDL